MDYAFDTNTVIHMMRGTSSVHENRERVYQHGARFFIPPVVNYEIRRGLIIKPNPKQINAYAVICGICLFDEMTDEIWECGARIYAELYGKHFTVSDADILIAAFCIINGCTLVTDNIRDFENINGVLIEDWVK